MRPAKGIRREVAARGLPKQTIDEREVILAFCRFDEFPGDWRQDSVERDGRESGPQRLHVLQAGGTGIEKLTAKHQEGFAVHHELHRDATFLQVWQFCVLRADHDGSGKQCRPKDNNKKVQSDSHGGAILPNLGEGCL
jgi:hypothetical protein